MKFSTLRRMSAWLFVAALLCALFALPVTAADAAEETRTNIAQGKGSYASSNQRKNGGVGITTPSQVGNLTDGNDSSFIVSHADDETPWFMVDLGAAYTIDTVALLWGANSTYPDAYATAYTVEVSASDNGWSTVADATTGWETAIAVTDGTAGARTLTFAPIAARYVRVTVQEKASQWASLLECRIYEAPASETVKIAAPSDATMATAEATRETCIALSKGVGFSYTSRYLGQALGVSADDDIRLEITLDYYWQTTRSTVDGGCWGKFNTYDQNGREAHDGGFGYFSRSWGFETINDWATTTVSRVHQRLGADGTGWSLKAVLLGAEDVIYIRGLRVTAVRADGTTTSAVWGSAPTAMTAALKGHNVELATDISLNFYMQMDEATVTDVAVFGMDGIPSTTLTPDRLTKDAETNAVIIPVRIAAKNLGDQVYIRVRGDRIAYTTVYTVKDYAVYLLNHTTDGKTQTLVKALLNYGALAQTYFSHNTKNLVNATLSDADRDVSGVSAADLAAYNVYNKTQTADGVTFTAANLTLLSQTTLRLFFTADSFDNVTFRCGDRELTLTDYAGRSCVELTDITPDKLAETITVSVQKDGAEIMTVEYTVMAYVYNVLNLTDDTYSDLQNVMRALCLYNRAAVAYTV